MPRIRSIKPEIATDAKLARLSRESRYHFVLLWTACDDAGYFRAAPRQLLGQLYPHDPAISEAEVDAMTTALATSGFVRIYPTDDGPIGYVINWPKHQKIDRPSKSHLQEVVARASRVLREAPSEGVLSPDLGVLSPESSSPPAWQPVHEQRLAERLTTPAGRNALATILQTAGTKAGIVEELEMLLDGHRGAQWRPLPDQLDVALSEYVTNGMSDGRWNAAHFKACLKRAMQPDAQAFPRRGNTNPGAQQIANILGSPE